MSNSFFFTRRFSLWILFFVVAFRDGMMRSLFSTATVQALLESDRVAEYKKRKYTYPLRNFIPNTPGWKQLMTDRLEQIAELDSADDRYEGYYQVIHSAALAPNFTEYGFALAKCPDDLLDALQQGIRDGLATATPEAQGSIAGPNEPLYVSRPDLTNRVLRELHHYTEAWVGFPLTAHQAYGFRLYQNESQLWMHTDRLQTHVVSFILHIDASPDADPWPIFIEDFTGRTHEVILTPGDILFYESSKCLHGRPRPFSGSWYTSVFVHYYPAADWIDRPHELEAHYAIPPSWTQDRGQKRKRQTPLEMVGTLMREPTCPNGWCRADPALTVQWGGPAEHGILITPDMQRHAFFPDRLKVEAEEEEEEL